MIEHFRLFLEIRSNGVCVHAWSLSGIRFFATPWTVALQATLSMGFSRQEYWSGLPFPSPGDLPDPGIKPVSSALAGGSFITVSPGKPTRSNSGDFQI